MWVQKQVEDLSWITNDEEGTRIQYQLCVRLRTGDSIGVICSDEVKMNQCYDSIAHEIEEQGSLFRLDK